MTKYVYAFEEGKKELKNLLGGKGANLAEMTNIGLPVPRGFTVTTEACTKYYDDGKVISKPAIIFNRVDLPVPLIPITPIFSPSFIPKLTLSKSIRSV
jgi:phosphoenolpyruvate synthase/pyruvate phosphate dikinase